MSAWLLSKEHSQLILSLGVCQVVSFSMGHAWQLGPAVIMKLAEKHMIKGGATQRVDSKFHALDYNSAPALHEQEHKHKESYLVHSVSCLTGTDPYITTYPHMDLC